MTTDVTAAHATSVRSPRRERTRERLLDAAFGLFSAHGIQGTSIEAICEAAGFTRGAFYSNFESKEELFHALVDRKARGHLAAIESAGTGIDAAAVATPEGLRDAVRGIVSSVGLDGPDHRDWCLMHAEFELLAMRDPQVAPRYRAEQERLRREVGRVLEALLDRVGLRFTVDTPTAVELLMEVESAGTRDAVLSGQDEAPALRRIERVVDLLVVAR
ncbi:TetR/AcrR family transcriptional regulator [Isoptericola aurantiacus]|uniref:TetR/AcrR family transcriptional regulator n=1 Tax=Isoptericola aurantiacus TaxID=3377839 RepID=UPI00383B246C